MNECYYDKRMDFFYNRSNTDTADEWTGTTLVIVLCVGTFFCLFIFFSNSLVIAAVIKNRKFHFPFYYLLANLAAADFFAGIAYVYLMFNTGPVSKTLTVNRWFLRQGLLDTSLTASLTNLFVIAVERHMSIMRMRVHSNLTKKRVTLLILSIWAIAIFMGAVPTLGWNCLCDISACSSLAPIYSRSYLIFWTVSNLMAFFIMVVVYLRIYMYVKRKTNVLSPHTSGSISRRRTPMKLMKTVMTVLDYDKASQIRRGLLGFPGAYGNVGWSSSGRRMHQPADITALRGLRRVLDPGPGGSAARRPELHAVQRAARETVVPAAGAAQLGHEPHHLLLQGRGHVQHHEEDDLLLLSGEAPGEAPLPHPLHGPQPERHGQPVHGGKRQPGPGLQQERPLSRACSSAGPAPVGGARQERLLSPAKPTYSVI
ncbi:lysophosphatidic acid receptor 3 isoform X1 [Camelus ferus]|uniref:Lysophosphatidic acid receptor 3 isoform X1 n=1 Tax=Camelus ferus TaxID=419612 RepID=A0A8B8U8G4_CAMFR|nr:lysophosphatidic acid receptor 3 isoform X1 [Camelus ferus]